jgi:hypothetical protein
MSPPPSLPAKAGGLILCEMSKFQLRSAKSNDVPGIRDLIAASVMALQAGDYSVAQREGALATVFTPDSQLIADGTYLVAMADGDRLAGCGGWSYRKTLYGGDHQVEKMEPERLDPRSDAAKIRAIFVHPDFARMVWEASSWRPQNALPWLKALRGWRWAAR